MKLFLIVAFVTVAAGPSEGSVIYVHGIRQLRMINGNNARPGQFPWQVSLQYHGSHYCGGSLISHTWVLTASHCKDNRAGGTKVIYGVTDLTTANPPTVSAAEFIRNPNYNNPIAYSNDLALIRLEYAIPFSTTTVKPIKLTEPSDLFVGYAATSGWGYTHTGAAHGTVPNKLKFGSLPFVTNAQCKIDYPGQIDDSKICAGGDGNAGSCMGDSGGPLIVHKFGVPTLIGVVSMVPTTCETNGPSVYESVAHGRPWIRRISGI